MVEVSRACGDLRSPQTQILRGGTLATESNLVHLLKKYDVPGPRYTSYPTVPDWCDNPTADIWIEKARNAIRRGNQKGQGIAIYIHIPFCKTLCTFCGCFQKITRKENLGPPYVQQVLKEWATYRKRLDCDSEISIRELHLGGGTPTFLSSEELAKLTLGIKQGLKLSEDCEFSIEVDPRRTTPEQIRRLYELGYRRISLGVQDFDPEVQRVVNRKQSYDQVKAVQDAARSCGFTSVNFDLIYGLPKQNLSSIEDTFKKVLTLKPDRLAFYSYAHVPWMRPAQKLFTDADVPEGDEKRSLYTLGREMAISSGYCEVGMDHFSLPKDSLWTALKNGELHRNFMGYTSRASELMVGLGISSIGDTWDAFAQNTKSFEEYEKFTSEANIPIFRGHILSTEDLVLRKHILRLMCHFETSWEKPEEQTPFLERAKEKLQNLVEDGLVELRGNHVKITVLGRPFLRNICMCFDARLDQRGNNERKFSRTI